MIFFLLWWCFDDHLASWLGDPRIGHVPWWIILLISLLIGAFTDVRR